MDAAGTLATAARCRIYRQFASAFMHPQSGHDHRLHDGTWCRHLRSLAQALPYDDPFASIEDPPQVGAAALSEIYASSFDVGQGALSLYGRSYRDRKSNEKALFEELFRFYEHFGLTFQDGLPEYPDSIVVELEFLHYLCFLEAEAADPAAGATLWRAERDFIDRQLRAFASGLAATLADKRIEVYAGVSRLLDAFVSEDASYLAAADG